MYDLVYLKTKYYKNYSMKEGNTDPLLTLIKFKEYFDSLVEYHPTKIYVSVDWAVGDLLSEVSIRYKGIIARSTKEEISIYSRSSNVNTVDKLKELEIIKQTFNCEDKNYHFGKESAKTTILSIK